MKRPRAVILVVEDYQPTRQLYCDALAQAGFHPVAADSVKSAIETVAAMEVDAVLLDLGVPGPGGGEALIYHFNALPEPPPIVVVSGRTMEPRERALVEAYLHKPARPVDVVAAVRTAVERRPRRERG